MLTARQIYRRQYHLKHKARENAKARERYHTKYKQDQSLIEKRRAAYREYAKRKGSAWVRARSKRYAKPIKLTEEQLIKKRETYKRWARKNWRKRVEYAKQYRRRHPLFGFRKAVGIARESGDLRELSRVCKLAVISLNE